MKTPNEMGFPKLRSVVISMYYYTQNFPFVKLILTLFDGVCNLVARCARPGATSIDSNKSIDHLSMLLTRLDCSKISIDHSEESCREESSRHGFGFRNIFLSGDQQQGR